MKQHSKNLRVLVASGIILTCIITPVYIADAQQDNSSFAQNFKSDENKSKLTTGAIVTGMTNRTDYVQLATQDNANQLIGVIDNYPLLSLSDGDKNIPVVLSGSTTVFVSDINGNIKSGDKITASPLSGVGMLASASGQVVGTATADFKVGQGTAKVVTGKDGSTHTVHIQKLPVRVGVAYYNAIGNSFLPSFIHDAADNIAGKTVPLIRILIGMVILLLSFAYTIAITYSSTRSTIAALGRNPLGSREIMRGQYRLMLIAAVTITGALLATYLLLIL